MNTMKPLARIRLCLISIELSGLTSPKICRQLESSHRMNCFSTAVAVAVITVCLALVAESQEAGVARHSSWEQQ